MTEKRRWRTHAEVHAEAMGDPAFRAEWEKHFLGETLALELAAYRARHGLTQRELAEQLGMQRAAVTRLETGEHEPSMALLRRLATTLGLRISIEIAPDGAHAHTTEVHAA